MALFSVVYRRIRGEANNDFYKVANYSWVAVFIEEEIGNIAMRIAYNVAKPTALRRWRALEREMAAWLASGRKSWEVGRSEKYHGTYIAAFEVAKTALSPVVMESAQTLKSL